MLPRAHPGDTEALLGRFQGSGIEVDTRVTVFGSQLGMGRGELKAARVRESLKGSLNRLKRNKVNTMIVPRPDAEVSLGEIAGGFGGLASEGSCEQVRATSGI
jgi:aryl-alcohol dehydrogenase-like predicted oxidoreductase